MPHTPGPWRIIEDKGALNEAYWIGPEPFHSICEVRNGAEDEEYGGEETEIANARLIAAAPELLEACREALLQIEYLHDKFKATGSGNGVLARLEATIANATTG